eukprot:TRINITY_DN5336_c0_g5_i1.p1 TRINITY_DN5336_c0_g5~~TRINITY_DN5336_c0_g5_i1.p1  ORF type:complete len:1048 (+),score=146.47 TRINITY_DN5336_c0_g5_i1:56-3199(+)
MPCLRTALVPYIIVALTRSVAERPAISHVLSNDALQTESQKTPALGIVYGDAEENYAPYGAAQAVELMRFVTAYGTALESVVDVTPYSPFLRASADALGNVTMYTFIDTWVHNTTPPSVVTQLYMNNVTGKCTPQEETSTADNGNGWSVDVSLLFWPTSKEAAAASGSEGGTDAGASLLATEKAAATSAAMVGRGRDVSTLPYASLSLAAGPLGSFYDIGQLTLLEADVSKLSPGGVGAERAAASGPRLLLKEAVKLADAPNAAVYNCESGWDQNWDLGLTLGYVARRAKELKSSSQDDLAGFLDQMAEKLIAESLVTIQVNKVSESGIVTGTYDVQKGITPGKGADVFMDGVFTDKLMDGSKNAWWNLSWPSYKSVGRVISEHNGAVTLKMDTNCLPQGTSFDLPRLRVPRDASLLPYAKGLLRRAAELGYLASQPDLMVKPSTKPGRTALGTLWRNAALRNRMQKFNRDACTVDASSQETAEGVIDALSRADGPPLLLVPKRSSFGGKATLKLIKAIGQLDIQSELDRASASAVGVGAASVGVASAASAASAASVASAGAKSAGAASVAAANDGDLFTNDSSSLLAILDTKSSAATVRSPLVASANTSFLRAVEAHSILDTSPSSLLLSRNVRFAQLCAGAARALLAGTGEALDEKGREVHQRMCAVAQQRSGNVLKRNFNLNFRDGDRVLAHLSVTGHGWESTTEQCGEYCHAVYHLRLNGKKAANVNQFRDDCKDNPIGDGLQQGTWWESRNGWCPGTVNPGLFVDVTDFLTPGDNVAEVHLSVWSALNNRYEPFTNHAGFALHDTAKLAVGLNLFAYDAAAVSSIRGQPSALTAAEVALRKGVSDPKQLQVPLQVTQAYALFQKGIPDDMNARPLSQTPDQKTTASTGDEKGNPSASWGGALRNLEANAPWYLWNSSRDGDPATKAGNDVVVVKAFSDRLVQAEDRTIQVGIPANQFPSDWRRIALHLRVKKPAEVEVDHWDRVASVGLLLKRPAGDTGTFSLQLHPDNPLPTFTQFRHVQWEWRRKATQRSLESIMARLGK